MIEQTENRARLASLTKTRRATRGLLALPGPLTRPQGRPRLAALVMGSLRVVLPLMALGLIAVVALWTKENLSEGRFHIGATEKAPVGFDRFSLSNARFEGIDAKDRPYSIIADRAVEVGRDSGIMELAQVKADITLDSGNWVAVTAEGGIYRRHSKIIDIKGPVSLYHDLGYAIEAASLRIDLDQRIAMSDGPVAAQGPEGHMSAEGFRLTEGGKRIEFLGRSRLLFYPDPAAASPSTQ